MAWECLRCHLERLVEECQQTLGLVTGFVRIRNAGTTTLRPETAARDARCRGPMELLEEDRPR